MRESLIEQYLITRVAYYRGEIRKVKWIGRRSAPDRLVMLPEVDTCGPAGHIPARQVWIELKATDEKATPAQAREHAVMRKFGLQVEVVDSLERVDEVLRR